MSIPIVNAAHEIVGWTDVGPEIVRNRLRHRGAERLLGGPIHSVEVVLTDRRQMAQAGAPAGWSRSWRCLALCSGERAGALAQSRRYLGGSDHRRAQTKSAAGPETDGARLAAAAAAED
jgi:hypothetical protein